MSTWGSLRDGVRVILKDTTVTKYTWSNADLLLFANHALDNLSGYYPLEKMATITAVADTYTYTLPTDFKLLDAISWPSSTITGGKQLVEVYKTKDNSWPVLGTSGLTGVNISYLLDYPDEGRITFTRVPPGDLGLYYRAWRPHLAADSDPVTVGRHWWMEEALAYYIAYQAYVQLSGPRAQLVQWSEKPENLVGNPLATEAEFWRKQYLVLVQENLPRRYPRFTEAFK